EVSIPEKWRTAERLAQRFFDLRKPVHIYYFGDLDPKGLLIPESAWNDIFKWTVAIINRKDKGLAYHADLSFERIGINEDQIGELDIPENPERPGTYQWEGLDDAQAESLISKTSEKLDLEAFELVKDDEEDI
ncbi:unnamed protein product, partial [marine sediment metagenome]